MAPAAGPRRCGFWLPNKNRGCRFQVAEGQHFCGNHLFEATGEGCRRIPCPADSTHTVLERELEAHMRTCPTRLRLAKAESQRFHRSGCNDGPGAPLRLPSQDASAPLAAQRAAHANGIGHAALLGLIVRIENAVAQVCPPAAAAQELAPDAAPMYQDDPLRPFSLRHARQQASMVGHMARAGLLADAAACTFVEFGAGTAYLSGLLCKCCNARNVVLLDCNNFRLKADRSMRHLNLQRLRIGIQDFWPGGHPMLSASPPADQPPVSQHGGGSPASQIDGEATASQPRRQQQPAVSQQPPSRECRQPPIQEGQQQRSWVAYGKHLCGAAADFTLRCTQQSLAGQPLLGRDGSTGDSGRESNGSDRSSGARNGSSGGCRPRGLCVATCCHHRCTWQHYVGKPLFEQLGFSPADFELCSWMTGWALCGHEAAEDDEDVEEDAEQLVAEANGAAAAAIPRWRRMKAGQACKKLIDHGRLVWLQASGFEAESIIYVPPDVTGENRLLIAKAAA